VEKIGLIGLGNIGTYFTDLLLEAGYPLTVYDIDKERMQAAVRKGAKAAESPGGVTRQSDIILLALPGSGPVEAVMNGQDGILNHMRPGQLVIDTGTSRPSTDIHFERLVREKGAGFLDAPVTFRKPGLIIMVGGEADQFEKGRRVLECLSYKLKHVGPIGHGQVLKLINQAILANLLAVYCEAFELSVKHGMDTRLLKDFLEFDVPDSLYTSDFAGGGHLALHYKDLLYLLEIAHDSGANIPISSLVHEIFKATKPYGDPNWRQPGIVTYWRRLNMTER
jgi:2-hydroxy-3-oxopropionate reductase